MQTIAYWGIYVTPAFTHGKVWLVDLPWWRIGLGALCGVLGIALASAGIRHLGKQWRVNAALNADHELVRSGPYSIVRHPIYASMTAMMLMSILLVGQSPWWVLLLAIFIAGIEVRVHVEDGLLRGRFGEEFETWRRSVPAYLPLVR